MLKKSKKFKTLVLMAVILIGIVTSGCESKMKIEDEYDFISDGLTSVEISLKTSDLDTRAIDSFVEKYDEYDLTDYQSDILNIIKKSDSYIDSNELDKFQKEFNKLKSKINENY